MLTYDIRISKIVDFLAPRPSSQMLPIIEVEQLSRSLVSLIEKNFLRKFDNVRNKDEKLEQN